MFETFLTIVGCYATYLLKLDDQLKKNEFNSFQFFEIICVHNYARFFSQFLHQKLCMYKKKDFLKSGSGPLFGQGRF